MSTVLLKPPFVTMADRVNLPSVLSSNERTRNSRHGIPVNTMPGHWIGWMCQNLVAQYLNNFFYKTYQH